MHMLALRYILLRFFGSVDVLVRRWKVMLFYCMLCNKQSISELVRTGGIRLFN